MANIDNIPVIQNPVLIDKFIYEVQSGLKDKFVWLDYAFGRAQTVVREYEGTNLRLPNVYAGGNDYIDLSPDSNIGNYSFFVLKDPQQIDWQNKMQGLITYNYALVFWFDLRTINGAENRNTELLKGLEP